jgi:hypothetical protein
MQEALLISYFVVLGVSCIICLYRRKMHEYPISSVWLFLAVTFVADSVAEYLHLTKRPFQFVYIIYAPFEYFCIVALYYYSLNNNVVKKIILTSVPIYLITTIISYFVLNHTTHYHIFNLRGCLTICILLFYFRELYKRNEIVYLKNEPMFWISLGSLFFWSGNFFLVGLISPLHKIDPRAAELLYLINPVLNIIFYLMLARALLCNRKVIQ